MVGTTSFTAKSAQSGTESSSANRCPLCDSDHWCFHLDQNAVICGNTDHAPAGWVKTGEAKDGRGIFAKEDRSRRRQGLPSPEEILPLALDPKIDSPQWVTLSTVGTESERQIEYLYPNPETGEPLGKVIRREWTDRRAAYGRNGKDTKQIRPWHWSKPYHPNQENQGFWSDRGKGSKVWPLYKEAEVRDALASGWTKAVFYVSGEQAAETARQLGLTTLTNQGGESTYVQDIANFLSVNKPELFVVWPDNDETGAKSATKLLKLSTKVGIPTVVLEPENIWANIPNKGDITDVVQKSGMEPSEIIERLEIEIHRVLLRQQDQPTSSEEGKDKKFPQPAAIARQLAERYRHELAWHTGVKLWYRYSAKVEGVWTDISSEAVNSLVIAYLESRPGLAGEYGFGYVSSCVNLLKAYLMADGWHEASGLIPMQDGVLQLATGELLPHAPGYRLLWCLPYAWKDRNIGCKPIQDWMLGAMKGDRALVKVLRAYLNAVVTGRLDLQRYLECIGPGGTGKGTYTRLAMALVGAENTAVTTLEQLEKNRFETAGIFAKRLLLITDSEKYGGEVSVLKAITGGDAVRYERKNVQQCKPFMPTCMVIVAANEPVQSGDYTSGLERRRLTLPFIYQVKPEERRDLDTEFKPYLPGLLAWALEMPDQEVTALVRNTSSTVRSLALWKAESLIETNPMAEWLDSCIVHNPAAKTYVGVAQRDKSSDTTTAYLFTDKWLYASYCEHSVATGSKAVSVRRFSTLLHDLCVNQLKLGGISKGRDNQGSYFGGLEIRSLYDERIRPITGGDTLPDEPPPSGGGGSPKPSPKPPLNDGFMTVGDGLVTESDGLVMAETLASDESDGSDAKNLNTFEEDLNLFNKSLEKQKKDIELEVNEIYHHFRHNPSLAGIPAVTDSSLELVEPSQTYQNPSPLPAQQSQTTQSSIPAPDQVFKVGDRVIWEDCPGACSWGNPFTITAIENDCARLDLIAKPVLLSELRRSP